MTATQSRGATLWRAAGRVAAALRAIHDEQVLAWEAVFHHNRMPADRAGPLTWMPSLDGPRLTGRYLPGSYESRSGRRP